MEIINRLLLVACFLFSSNLIAQSCLVWEDDGGGPVYNIDGLTVSYAATTSLAAGDGLSFFLDAVGQQGNHTGYLGASFDNNNFNPAERFIITFTFAVPVKELEFSVLDIDEGNYDDNIIVNVDGVNGTTAGLSSLFTLGGACIVRDDETYFEGWEGNCFATTTETTSNLNFDSGSNYITTFSIEYFTGDDFVGDPGFQVFGISDICWETEANISVTKTDATTTYTPGGTSSYTITVSNAGPMNATGVTVVDSLPNGASNNGNWVCTSTNASCITGQPIGTGTTGSANINQVVDLPVGSSITFTVPIIYSTDPTDYQP